jgi:hypothetical protein
VGAAENKVMCVRISTMKNSVIVARGLRSIVNVVNSMLNMLEAEMDHEATATQEKAIIPTELSKDIGRALRRHDYEEKTLHQKRSEAAKKAWVTIRANKAKAAKKLIKSK